MEPLNQAAQNQQSQIHINTPAGLPCASVFERAIAFVIDFMLWATVSSLAYKIVNTSHTAIYGIFSALAFVLYVAVFTTGNLKTVGKFLLGIKVVDRKTKQNLTFGRAFLRAIGYVIDFFTAFLGFAFVFFSRKRLALEDLLAGTEVVTTRQKTAAEMTLISLFGTLLIIGALSFVYNNLIFNPYKAMKASAEKQLAKVAYLEELHKKRYGVYTTDLLRLALLSGDAVQFQRDMQQYFRPKEFKIGISKDGYYIQGRAKDNADPKKSSMVYFSK